MCTIVCSVAQLRKTSNLLFKDCCLALGAMGRVVLQENDLPSQHVYRSMRRRNAREWKEAQMMTLKLELGQLKYEKAALHEEVLSWRSWYEYDGWNLACNSAELVEGSAETATGLDTYELPTKVATDLLEVSTGIDVLLQELTSLRHDALDESADMGSLASRPGIGSDISDSRSVEAYTRKTSSSCMGIGRGCKSRGTVPATDERAVANQPAERTSNTCSKSARCVSAREEIEAELESRLWSSCRELLGTAT